MLVNAISCSEMNTAASIQRWCSVSSSRRTQSCTSLGTGLHVVENYLAASLPYPNTPQCRIYLVFLTLRLIYAQTWRKFHSMCIEVQCILSHLAQVKCWSGSLWCLFMVVAVMVITPWRKETWKPCIRLQKPQWCQSRGFRKLGGSCKWASWKWI